MSNECFVNCTTILLKFKHNKWNFFERDRPTELGHLVCVM